MTGDYNNPENLWIKPYSGGTIPPGTFNKELGTAQYLSVDAPTQPILWPTKAMKKLWPFTLSSAIDNNPFTVVNIYVTVEQPTYAATFLVEEVEQGQMAISAAVVSAFSAIPEVVQIYLEPNRDTLVYWVFSNEESHNWELSQRMTEQQMGIMDQFPQSLFDFHFVPIMLCPDPKECIPVHATAMYQR